jgi:hypothetical protein
MREATVDKVGAADRVTLTSPPDSPSPQAHFKPHTRMERKARPLPVNWQARQMLATEVRHFALDSENDVGSPATG